MNISGIRSCALLLTAIAAAGPAQAALGTPPQTVPAVVTSTFFVNQNTRLTTNVTCQTVGQPCLQFSAPNVTLDLNGFTLAGSVVPGACAPGPVENEDAIDTGGQNGVRIVGPGFVRLFRGNGVDVSGGRNVTVRSIIVATHCANGIRLNASNSRVENNVAIRNSGNAVVQGGGIFVLGNNNRVTGNEVSGNGVENNAAFGPIDFGIGVSGSNNAVIGNSAVGNTPNGVVINVGALNNELTRNLVIGNPPIAVPALQGGASQGIDIRNLDTTSSTVFTDNLCGNGISAPCPNVPEFAGHANRPAGTLLDLLLPP